MAADEQRATAERARSLAILSGHSLQFCWDKMHQLGLVKTHQPGWRLCSILIFSIVFLEGTHIKGGQTKKPPDNNDIWGEEAQEGC